MDMANAVALNIDLGELPGEPEELYRLATVVNVACGGHAGDASSMARAVDLASGTGARIAAHPSYPDRAGFGRRTIAISPSELRRVIAEQCAALQRIAAGAVRTVKPHGALYHDAARDPEIAAAVMEGAATGLGTGAPIWVGPSRGALYNRAVASKHPYEREAFADRLTLPDGSLVPRDQLGALIEDPALAAQLALAHAYGGKVDTVCVHSDTQGAVAIARAVRAALTEAGMLGRQP